ncbi:hypothetical protein F4680DRAFT_436573 [Xylaria scruposa]|nr:hypothetical protein F4680DRAFT_436573 [Xylaria scruposa]
MRLSGGFCCKVTLWFFTAAGRHFVLTARYDTFVCQGMSYYPIFLTAGVLPWGFSTILLILLTRFSTLLLSIYV